MNQPHATERRSELAIGFFAPIDSLKFLGRHKFLLLLGLVPHLVGFVAYIWALYVHVVPFVSDKFASYAAFFSNSVAHFLLAASTYVAGLVLYTLVGLPLVSTLASPLFDIIAARTYEETAALKLPTLGFTDMVRSFLSECSKLTIIFSILAICFFIPLLGPVAFVVSLWFFGWDHMDRTLSLMGLNLRQRIAFGLRHSLTCLSLGLWSYVPFAGTLLSFVMSAAGAYAVARAQTSKECQHLEGRHVPSLAP